jgi:hypothetical protein
VKITHVVQGFSFSVKARAEITGHNATRRMNGMFIGPIPIGEVGKGGAPIISITAPPIRF